MAMQMTRAFSAHMMTRLDRYDVAAGSRASNNDWVDGTNTLTTFYGVIRAGNKFSQFDEGEAVKIVDSGTRYSDYRSLFVKLADDLKPTDIIGYQGKYFKILQTSDEATFGFMSYLLEKLEDWTP